MILFGLEVTYCLNATTGSQVWSYKTGNILESSPAVVNGVVYIGSYDGKIYAFGPSLPKVPEFASYLILPLFMMATLLAALVLKRKRNARTQSSHTRIFRPFVEALALHVGFD